MVKLLAASAAEDRWLDFEAAVDATPSIDPWCSGPDWVQPVASAFAGDAQPILLEEPGAGFALLARHQMGEIADEANDIIAGLEPLWGFASPIIGTDLKAVARALTEWLRHQRGWDRLVLPGLPKDGVLVRLLAEPLSELGPLGIAAGITRQVIDLSQGSDSWLERRQPKFRRNLRNAQRRGREAGLTFVDLDSDHEVFGRIMAIEQQSWKGQAEDGITSPEMGNFYRHLVSRLMDRGRLRATIAMVKGQDVGYILGGVRGDRYRGLQLSYVPSAKRLSVSHLLQLREINRLTEEGQIATYDMGMDMDYKQRWADRTETSIVLVLERE